MEHFISNDKRKMIDLSYINGWKEGGIEYRLCDMVEEAGYHFVMVSHNERGTDTVYECKEVGLRYHVDSSD